MMMSNADLLPEPPASEAHDTGAAGPASRFQLTRVEWVAMVAVLIFYASTRLYGIVDYPVYFFCDEALQANLAHDLVVNDFRDENGTLCPAYFRNVRVFNLGLSVWIHSIPVTVFGKTVLTVRATSVVVGLSLIHI